MPEDSARHVDWKATAKSGSLKVREFAREDERKLCIVFDNPESGLISARAYEKAVDLAASLAWHFSTQQAELSFVVPGRQRTRDLHQYLAWLAVIEPGRQVGEGGATKNSSGNSATAADPLCEMNLSASDGYNIVITARPRGSLPTSLWNCSYVLYAGDDVIPAERATQKPIRR
jgi:hypothetical protein